MRLGVELEGRFKGLSTAVALGVGDHDVSVVDRTAKSLGFKVEHVWLQRAEGESYDWDRVERFVAEGYRVTVLLMGPGDVPPPSLLGYDTVCFVLRVPQQWGKVFLACNYANVPTGRPFELYETELKWGANDPTLYYQDMVVETKS